MFRGPTPNEIANQILALIAALSPTLMMATSLIAHNAWNKKTKSNVRTAACKGEQKPGATPSFGFTRGRATRRRFLIGLSLGVAASEPESEASERLCRLKRSLRSVIEL
jgi:hypothetical protein